MKILALLLTAGIVTLLAGCNLPILPSLTQTPGNASLTATSPSAVNPIIVIVTPLTQSAPTSLAPTPSPVAPPKIYPTVEQVTPTSSLNKVNIFLVALEDNGISGKKIGCDDSLLPVSMEIAPTYAALREAFNQLLALDDPYFGESGLYTALYQSDLEVEDITLKDGDAFIYLTGSLVLGGVCDSPRVEAQLTETAMQFSTVKTVTIYINGKLLKDALSLKD